MAISQAEIQHIAELARLELSPAESEAFGVQLDSILDYVRQLEAVDTKKVVATAQVSGLVNVFRNDDFEDWDTDELGAALSQGELDQGRIKVKRVL